MVGAAFLGVRNQCNGGIPKPGLGRSLGEIYLAL
jgi:hypothetical protein